MNTLSAYWSISLMTNYVDTGPPYELSWRIKHLVHKPGNQDCLYRLRNGGFFDLFRLVENAK